LVHFGRGFQPAFPYNQDAPAEFFQFRQILFVAGFVGLSFGLLGKMGQKKGFWAFNWGL